MFSKLDLLSKASNTNANDISRFPQLESNISNFFSLGIILNEYIIID